MRDVDWDRALAAQRAMAAEHIRRWREGEEPTFPAEPGATLELGLPTPRVAATNKIDYFPETFDIGSLDPSKFINIHPPDLEVTPMPESDKLTELQNAVLDAAEAYTEMYGAPMSDGDEREGPIFDLIRSSRALKAHLNPPPITEWEGRIGSFGIISTDEFAYPIERRPKGGTRVKITVIPDEDPS